MLPLPDYRPFAALGGPRLMAILATVAAAICALAVLRGQGHVGSLCAGAFLVATYVGWSGSLARSDAIRNTATSTANGAALGYVELVGAAQTAAQPALRSQIRKHPCVWYRYLIERRVGASWVVESSAASADCFLLRDATGDCVVDPEGAEISARRRRRWREFEHRFDEQWIAPGDRLYVLGELTSISAALDSPDDFRRDVSALLAQWKQDPDDLLRRFDGDCSGVLSDSEWGEARREATIAVKREYTARRSLSPLNVMRKPRDGRRYLISAYEPAELARRFALWAWLHLALFVTGLVGLAVVVG